MISPEHVHQILTAAVSAPSGDNSQPWKFGVHGNEITLFNVPEADQSLYNSVQNASIISHGCLLGNLRLASAQLGFKAEIELPENNEGQVVAHIRLVEQSSPRDELYDCIALRSSNRKPYSTTPLPKGEIDYLLDEQGLPSNIRVVLKGGAEKDTLAIAASVNEKIVLENRLLHGFLFDHVTWSKAEDKKKHGFYIDTFELRAPQKIAFRLFSHWKILQLFNKIGASDFISRDNAELYKKSAAIGAIIASDTTRKSYINSGIALQKVWLRATKLGIGFQPLTGVTLLMQHIREDGGTGLSAKHIELIRFSYRQIEEICGKPDGNIFDAFPNRTRRAAECSNNEKDTYCYL